MGLVPFPDKIAQAFVGRAVVPADVVPEIGDVVGIFLFLEPVQAGQDAAAVAHRGVVVERVAFARHPEQDAFLSGRRDPVAGFVAPLGERKSDAMGPVGSGAEVSHAALGQCRDDAPRVAGNVGDHCRVTGQPVVPGESACAVGEFKELFGPAEGREFVPVQGIQADGPLLHGVNQRRFLFVGGLFKVAVDGPQALGQPFKSGAFRVVPGRAGEFHGLFEMFPLPGHHLRLDMGVPDIEMGMVQNVDLPLAGGFQRGFHVIQHLPVFEKRNLQGARLFGGRHGDVDPLGTGLKGYRLRSEPLDGDVRLARRSQVEQVDSDRLHKAAIGISQ